MKEFLIIAASVLLAAIVVHAEVGAAPFGGVRNVCIEQAVEDCK